MFKRFFKNKKGDFAVMGIIIIPVLVSIVFFTIFKEMEYTTSMKTVQTTVDNIMFYASKEYGDIKKDKNGNQFCDFDAFVLNGDENTTVTQNTIIDDKEKLLWQFDSILKKCDSYNSLWQYEIKIEKNTNQSIDASLNENNEYLTATVVVVMPAVNNESSMEWGTADSIDGTMFSTDSSLWTGWYSENAAHWQNCIERYNEWHANNYYNWLNGLSHEQIPQGIYLLKIEVTTSCL